MDYYDLTNIKANVYVKAKQRDEREKRTPPGSLSVNSTIAVETILERTGNTKLKLKFLPLEPIEHVIDISDNDIPIESKLNQPLSLELSRSVTMATALLSDFPLKLHVFPNKEIYMVNNSLNGVKFGDVAKFCICLNGQNESLEVKATSTS